MTRWIKVYRDFWKNRSRTVLIILSIAAGVFSIGLIGMAQSALAKSLDRQYAAMRPADITNLDDDIIESIRQMRGVEEAESYNELYLAASGTTDPEIQTLASEAEDRIGVRGLPVYQKTLPVNGEHPLNYIITTVLILLGLVAVLSMFLSTMLVINVISAMIAQQERQIGIMKADGARAGHSSSGRLWLATIWLMTTTMSAWMVGEVSSKFWRQKNGVNDVTQSELARETIRFRFSSLAICNHPATPT